MARRRGRIQASKRSKSASHAGASRGEDLYNTLARTSRDALGLARSTSTTRLGHIGDNAPQSSSILGARRIEKILRQEPFVRRAITKWSGAAVKEWFRIVDPKTREEHPDNAALQAWMRDRKIKAKTVEALEASRGYGDGLFELEWDDTDESTSPVDNNAVLLDVHVVDPVTVDLFEVDIGDAGIGTGLTQRVAGDTTTLHPDRLIHLFVDRLPGHLRGLSAVEVAFHSSISKIMGDQGSGEIVYHAGVPTKHASINKATKEEINVYTQILTSPKFSRALVTDERVSLDQLNPTALDPTPFYNAWRQNAAAAVGIPEMIVLGAQAGAVTGSETNIEDFHADLSMIRENVLNPVFETIVRGATGLQTSEFLIEWNPFPVNEERFGKTIRDKTTAWVNLVDRGVDAMAAARICGFDIKQEDLVLPPEGELPAITEADQ